MAQFDYSIASLRQNSSDIRDICEVLVELISRLDDLDNSMSNWNSKFNSKYRQTKPILNEFVSYMREHAQMLDEGATFIEIEEEDAKYQYNRICQNFS